MNMTGRILVVDGVPTARYSLKARLSAACYDVSAAATADEALRMARMLSPQIVILGANLTDMDAPQLCRALRQLPHGDELAVLVAARPGDRLAALQAGATALIEPVGDDLTLLARIRGLMRHDDGPVEVAYGLAESAAGFQHADDRPRAVFVAESPAIALAWRHALQDHVGFSIAVRDADRALAEAASGRSADLYLIAADIAQPGDGLRLLSELRSRPGSRAAAFVMVLRGDRADMAPVALDLGAGDVLSWDLASIDKAPEAAVRLQAQLGLKHEADRRRRETRRNMQWAMTDPLTGLYNRRHALPRLTELTQLARDRAEDLAVMLLDLDRFKLVNDVHGHAAGDAVLVETARRMALTLPADALLARIGGEEFLIALPGHGTRAARHMADELRQAIMRQPIALPDSAMQPQLTITASVGVMVAPGGSLQQGSPDCDMLLAHADRALLNAKALGRNRIVMAAPVLAA